MSGTPDVPSIKGTAFRSAPEDLLRLLREGRVDRDRLEASLAVEDLAFFDEKVNPAAWYPLASYARMVELLAEIEAPGAREAYWVERGRRAAERLASSGIYQQFEARTDQLGVKVGHFVITIAGVIYSVGSWSYESRDAIGRFRIEVTDAQELPEVARYATQGFIEAMSSRVSDRPIRVTSARPSPDRIVYEADHA